MAHEFNHRIVFPDSMDAVGGAHHMSEAQRLTIAVELHTLSMPQYKPRGLSRMQRQMNTVRLLGEARDARLLDHRGKLRADYRRLSQRVIWRVEAGESWSSAIWNVAAG